VKIQIDQSGKIEQTNKATVLCLSNKTWDTVFIKARTKRQIQEIFRRNGQTKNFVIFTFSACLSLLIKRNLKHNQIFIDKEYYGKDAIIKEILLEMLKQNKQIPEIHFANIGRQVKAHTRAYLTFTKKQKYKCLLSLKEILTAIKKTEVGKRLKEA